MRGVGQDGPKAQSDPHKMDGSSFVALLSLSCTLNAPSSHRAILFKTRITSVAVWTKFIGRRVGLA